MKKFLALFLSLITMLCLTSCKLITIDGEDNGGGADFTGNGSIGLSVSTQNNPFFVTLVEGAKEAAKKADVQLVVVDAGDDAAKQVSDIEDLIAKNVSVLIVNPVDSDTVSSVVQDAVNKGVKVISADRVVNGVDIDCQIASDNVLGAELATQYIVDQVGEGAKVAELQGTSGASAAIDRGEGFHNIADAKLKVVASQPADFDRTKGMTVMENMLQANGDIKAVFAANDEMALGAMEAISASRKDILVVGFDATDDAISSIKDGKMGATIAQQPDLIGATSVETAHKGERYTQPIFKVQAVDTTAAGDTFTGYFLAGIIDRMAIPDVLKMSAKASSIAVTRHGAVQSIPFRKEVEEELKTS